MPLESDDHLRLEIGHVLFLDIVGYSKLLIEDQKERLRQLTSIVLGTAQVRESTDEQLVRLPTGDGMALVFRHSAEEAARCALEIAEALRKHPELPVRMGIHSGPVSEVIDVSGRTNIAGAGINMAQRVMDCGDAGHILLSQHVADDLMQYRQWAPRLHDLGDCEVKHGARLHLVNLYAEPLGNPEPPEKLKQSAAAAAIARPKRIPWREVVVVAVLLALMIGAGLFFFRQRAAPQTSSAPTSKAAPVVPEKSIAVLPFANLSDEKANAYFAEGMQDEILTGLAKITALKVISRTSTEHYKSKADNVRQVGEELGVANILEGSVQKVGDMVHINVQLIRAGTDEHIWAESYDRTFQNVFSIEREIAETVATKLSALLSPNEAHELARLPTKNAQAYDLYLRAKYIAYQYWDGQVDSAKPALDLFQQAIKLDPGFAEAYVESGSALVKMYNGGEERSRAQLEQAQAAAEKALVLLPDSAPAHLLLVSIWRAKGDTARAAGEIEYLEKQTPKTAEVWRALAFFQEDRGDREASLQGLLRANELDPRNEVQLRWLADNYTYLRRNAEADKIYRQALAIAPEDWVLRANADQNLAQCGRISEGLHDLESWPDEKLTATARTFKYSGISYLEILSRHYDRALAAAQKVPLLGDRIATSSLPIGDITRNTGIGFCFLYLGDKVRSREAFLAARKGLEPQRATRGEDLGFLQSPADIATGLGEYENALAAAQKAVALAPREKNFDDWAGAQAELAEVHAQFGKAPEAVTILRALVATVGTGYAAQAVDLQLHPMWDPIRQDPEFARLLRDLQTPSPNE